jgi:hypothetical protein
LLLVAAGIHAWQIRHTAVTARDGVGFIRYAWQLQSQPWVPVLRENPHPPGYPLAVLAVSGIVRHFGTEDETSRMQLSAQLANALAGVLLVVPMFFLGRELFDRRVGFGAALLFQCLPVASRTLADALTEGTFLLLVGTALLFAVRAIQRGGRLRFALCGAFAGLAYLTRPEGVLVVVAVGLVIVGLQCSPAWRRSWREFGARGACLAMPALAVAAPYMLAIGHVTNKTTGKDILQAAFQQPEIGPRQGWTAGPQHAVVSLAVFGPRSKELDLFRRHLWCLGSIGREVVKGYHYLAWLPALAGLYWFRGRLRQSPGGWVLLALVLLDVLVLWRVAFVEGYVAERHTLVTILGTVFWAVAAVGAAGDAAAAALRRLGEGRWWARGPVWSAAIFLVLAGAGMPRTLAPLHTNRTGFHEAGAWLALHAEPGDHVLDPFSWVEFYSGQVYQEVRSPSTAAPPADLYVVLGGTPNEHERLPLMAQARLLAAHGRMVFRWPDKPIKYKAEEVEVYQVPQAAPR